MKKLKSLICVFIWLSICISVFGQKPMQSITGIIVDESSNYPIAFANVHLQNTNPVIGTVTDTVGSFALNNVPVGRYNLEVSYIGYEGRIVKELLVTSSKTVSLKISLKEIPVSLGEVTVKPTINKSEPLNKMATASARMLSVEEANRYAGGFDDLARLVSSFAGVASGVNNNAIAVRGNAPKSLQWKLEGVEIPNPNHFADLQSFGGGAVTALSGQLLANSDFLTGAFPAEFNNALSGVFDIYMRPGNNSERENTIQLGALGIDLATEGPFSKNSNSSYLINYRYSTFGLVGQLTNANEGIEYQDLSFKLNFPTKKGGVFSLWGMGLEDKALVKVKEDSTEQFYAYNREEYDARQFNIASGLSHKIFLNKNMQLKTTLATTLRGIDWEVDALDDEDVLQKQSKIDGVNSNYIFTSSLNSKLNKKHTNKTGVSITGLQYNMLIENAPAPGNSLVPVSNDDGLSILFAAYTSSSYSLNYKWNINAGLNAQVFSLNKNYTIEPRLGVKYIINADNTLGLAYGLHSRLEKINTYYTIGNDGTSVNKDLDFAKSHHIVLSYTSKLSENLLFKVEPYYQYLFNIPVVQDSPFSLINLKNDWFINYKLVNSGKGKNLGIDLTLERYLNNGYYYLVSASLFQSEYMGGDKKWYNTRYNQNYLINILGGKEWYVGKQQQNIFGINARMTYQGGERYTPYLKDESLAAQEVIFDESRPFDKQFDPAFILHFSISYKMNKERRSHEIALKVLNATSYGDFNSFEYNYIENTIDKTVETIMIPNISYRIDF